MAAKKKAGRPPNKTAKVKVVHAYLDPDRVAQLAALGRHHKMHDRNHSSSAAIAQAISFHHAHLKKEWPDEFC